MTCLLLAVVLQTDPLACAVADLADDDPAVRDEATQRLRNAGLGAAPILTQAATSKDVEVRSRAEDLLDELARALFGAALSVRLDEGANGAVWLRITNVAPMRIALAEVTLATMRPLPRIGRDEPRSAQVSSQRLAGRLVVPPKGTTSVRVPDSLLTQARSVSSNWFRGCRDAPTIEVTAEIPQEEPHRRCYRLAHQPAVDVAALVTQLFADLSDPVDFAVDNGSNTLFLRGRIDEDTLEMIDDTVEAMDREGAP